MRFGILGNKGCIGSCIESMLLKRGYDVVSADVGDSWDGPLASDITISCLPTSLTRKAAELVSHAYVDLSESLDSAKTSAVCGRNKKCLYLPNCGLAPGAVNIIAAYLIGDIPADEATIYCGALPANCKVGYQVSWSAEGLVGIYSNGCYELINGQIVKTSPRTGYETLYIENEAFEAFRTSGGIGTLPFSFARQVNKLYYKTLRYPGHLARVQPMLFQPNPAELLRQAFPMQGKDTVIIRIEVRRGWLRTSYEYRINPAEGWTAIQRATAESAIAACLAARGMTGYVRQEQLPFGLWASEAHCFFS